MKHTRTAPVFAALAAIALLITGCRSVNEGPSLPPDPNAQNEIRGIEPKPARIPQKNVPEGESSLRHNKPDQRIDKPNG